MKQTSRKYSELEFTRNEGKQDENRRSIGHGVQLNPHEWDEAVQTLAAICDDRRATTRASAPAKLGRIVAGRQTCGPVTHLKTEVISPLQEDDTRFYAIAVLSKANDRLKLATITWPKEPFESWLTRVEKLSPATTEVTASAGYNLPQVSDGVGC